MCGRYAAFADGDIAEMSAILAEVRGAFGDGVVSVGEICPTNTAPILLLEGNRLTPRPAVWGFPKWGGKGVVINARGETALRKPMFSKALLTRRCVVPSTGFYEWAHIRGANPQLSFFTDLPDGKPSPKAPKAKMLFNVPGEQMLYMAGMIDTITDASGKPKDVFCILTTKANHTMAQFHDRMPVVLSRNEREDWISSDAFMREAIARDGIDLGWQAVS